MKTNELMELKGDKEIEKIADHRMEENTEKIAGLERKIGR